MQGKMQKGAHLNRQGRSGMNIDSSFVERRSLLCDQRLDVIQLSLPAQFFTERRISSGTFVAVEPLDENISLVPVLTKPA